MFVCVFICIYIYIKTYIYIKMDSSSALEEPVAEGARGGPSPGVHSTPETLSPEPSTLNPKPQTLNPRP